jgi:putative DNA primase/helicase
VEHNRLEAELKAAYKAQTSRRINAIIDLARSHPNVKTVQSQWDVSPDLLATPNGVIDLITGKLRDGRQSDMLSHAIPVKYDPDAKCARWEQFLNEILEGPEEIREMQKFLGYCLTGQTTEQVVAFLQGEGSNGKSKLITALTELMGWDENGYSWRMDMACLDESSRNNIPNDLAALVGKRVAVAAEARPETRIDVAKVKMLSGEDVIPGRRLYAEHFNFRPSAKIILNVNHLPEASDSSNGYWRRALCWRFVCDFERPGSGKDKDLSEKLRKEYSGILNWLLQGTAMWRREGITPTSRMLEMTRGYRESNDPLGNFARECLVFEERRTVSIADLKARAEEWQRSSQEPFEMKNLRQFLLRKGCKDGRGGGARLWKGVGLKDEPAPDLLRGSML